MTESKPLLPHAEPDLAAASEIVEFGARELEEAQAHLRRALEEDAPRGDVTSDLLIPQGVSINACIVPRQGGVLCGIPVVAALFREIEPAISLRPLRSDGDRILAGESFLEVAGPASPILRGERVALNFLQRLSGIATATRRFVEAVRGTQCLIYDTRKTTPGWRVLEKYAVRVGGGRNHRRDLSELVLIKDNHRQLLEKLGEADIGRWIQRVRELRSDVPVELEVDSLADLEKALSSDLDIVLLDNFPLDDLTRAVAMVRAWSGKKPLIEASGGIALENATAVAATGVDRIAVGAITHSAAALDIGLDFGSVRGE